MTTNSRASRDARKLRTARDIYPWPCVAHLCYVPQPFPLTATPLDPTLRPPPPPPLWHMAALCVPNGPSDGCLARARAGGSRLSRARGGGGVFQTQGAGGTVLQTENLWYSSS
eukprot:2990103-Prymnesium_polylepis.2